MTKTSNKSKKPALVSIITTCYNSGKYLEDCIKSVLAQDYPYVEHVIQDGGSEDETLAIIKEYARKYKKIIKWSSEKDRGQADGLNKALQRINGAIILVLNSDDVLLPYACSWGVENLQLYPEVAVVYGDQYIINEKGEIINFFIGPEPYDFEKIFCVEQVIPAQSAFIKREALEKVGLYADTSLATCPDYEMWVRLGLKFSMKHVYGPISKYRWHEKSEGQRPEMIDKMLEAKKKVMNRYFNNRETSLSIRKLKRRAYAGVYNWASSVAATIGARKKVPLYLIKSIYYSPKIGRIVRLGYISFKYLRIIIIEKIKKFFR